MAQVIDFPRPINRPMFDDAREDRGGAALLRLDRAVVDLLDSEELWHARIDDLLQRLDGLGRFIDALDDSEAKGALRESHAAICRALSLTGDGLKLQFQLLSGLHAGPFDREAEAAEPTTEARSRGGAIASWLRTRIWPFPPGSMRPVD